MSVGNFGYYVWPAGQWVFWMPKCALCKRPTALKFGLTAACTIEHAIAIIDQRRKRKERKAILDQWAAEKVARKALREAKERIKTRAQWIKEAQAAFNSWIRERDRNEPCISCRRFHAGSYDAGHYRSVGSNPSLRFEPLNCWKQCVPCNQHRSGNSIEYRISLVKRIGADKVEWLEGPHEPKKYTIEELKEIKAKFIRMRKELEKERL